jgi:hypothetical protein
MSRFTHPAKQFHIQRPEFVTQKVSVRKFPLALLWWHITYVRCMESIRPFWISRELVAWPWCNLAASQRRPYCASVNSHSPLGQWDAVDWACVLCDRHIQNDQASRSASSRQCACPFYSSRAGFWAKHHITQICQPLTAQILVPFDFWLFPKLKLPLKGSRFFNTMVTQYKSSITGISLPTD